MRSCVTAMSHSLDTSRYRADTSGRFTLKSHRADALPHGMTKEQAEKMLADSHTGMRDLQEKLYAQDEWSLLVLSLIHI